MSLFSTLVEQINEESPSVDCHLLGNEYFAAFDSVDQLEQFHTKIIDQQPAGHEPDRALEAEHDDHDMDMKSFAQQFLVDLPEPKPSDTPSHELFSGAQAINWSPKVKDKRQPNESTNSHTRTTSQRHRRNIRDLPESSSFIFMADNDNLNIFDCLKERPSAGSPSISYDDMGSILLTLDVKQKKSKHSNRTETDEPVVAMELAEPSIIKDEPVEPEQVCSLSTRLPVRQCSSLQVTSKGPMGFGTAVL